MPLFKGQGCKSTPGKAIDYITNEKKAEIISSQFLDNSRSYAEQFKETAELFGKGKDFDERKYYHFKLSCDQADNVSASEHHEYAEALAERLFPNHECVIATHTDTDTVHSHIIVNAVNFEDGHKLHCNNHDYLQMKDVANEMGQERGYSKLIYNGPNHDNITRAEREITLKGGMSWKEELREVIAEAKTQTTNMADFEKHLNDYGVTLTRNTDKTIAYLHPKKDKAIRGEKLGADYTKGAILDVFDKQKRQHTNTEGDAFTIGTAGQSGDREQHAQGGIGAVERELRNIIDGVKGLTSDGRAEQAERQRADEIAARSAACRAEQKRRELEERKRVVEQQHKNNGHGFDR